MAKDEGIMFDRPHVVCSDSIATSGSVCYDQRPFEPLYQTIPKRETPVSKPSKPNDEIKVARHIDYDPNMPAIDADRLSEEQELMRQLSLHADARFAGFMAACSNWRAGGNSDAEIEKFVDTLVLLYMDGRMELPTTERHTTMMRLVLKAALIAKTSSQG